MSKPIRLAGVVRESIVDGPGIRFTVFVQGCPHHCEGCHNPETHDFSGGYDCAPGKILAEIKKIPCWMALPFPAESLFARRKHCCRWRRKSKNWD